MKGRALAAALLSALTACSKGKGPGIPEVEDAPVVGRVERKDIPDLVPAYGIAQSGGRFAVNIEAADAARVAAGQSAVAYVLPSREPIPCRVANVMRDVSAETHQAIAWLSADKPGAAAPNDFVTAKITVAVRRRVLAVPEQAVMIREGRTMVLRQAKSEAGKASYEAAAVTTGLSAGGEVEISSGVKEGDSIVVSGGIGLLFPDFKASTPD